MSSPPPFEEAHHSEHEGDDVFERSMSDARGATPSAKSDVDMELPATMTVDGQTVDDGHTPTRTNEPYAASVSGSSGKNTIGRDTPGMERNASFSELPAHLKPLARQIRILDVSDFILISEMTQRVASRELYSLLPYTGSNWYLPEIHVIGEDDPQWGITYDARKGVMITVSGRQLQFHIGAWLIRAAVLALFWYMLYFVLGSSLMTRGGYVWDPLVTVVVSAVVGGVVCRFLQVPPLLGVLWIAIMWNNIPYVGFLTNGIYKDVSKISQRLGLVVVLARAGFSLSLKSIKPHAKESLMLATLPYGFQAVTHALVSQKLFGITSYTWAFLEGCLGATASPAIVVPGVLYLQEQGYGRVNGPLTLMLSAVGIEVCCGVWASNFIIGLLFGSTPIATAIVLGPVQIIGGILLGILVGIGFHYLIERIKAEADRLPNGKYTQEHIDGVMILAFAIFMFFNIGFVFFGYAYTLSGGGAVMNVFFSATVAHMWIKDDNKEMLAHKAKFGNYLASLWDVLIMPLLFSMVGINVVLKDLFNSEFTPKAIAVIAISCTVRAIVTYLIQIRSPYDWRQKLIVCGGYLGKATAQAAIGPTALANVKNLIALQGLTDELVEMKHEAQRVFNMSMLYIIICALIAALTMTKAGPKYLPRDVTRR